MTKYVEYHENLCFKCLEKSFEINKYYLSGRGYGSDFDNFNSKLQLCDKCNCPEVEEWFDEKPELDQFTEIYKYEKKIHNFINSLPLQGQELFENQCADGAFHNFMENQDWIDMKLGIMPDEKYKEYSMYSPSEIKAYEENFPTCEHPVNIIYSDDSKGCRCPFGAFGEYGQKAGLNVWDACYQCPFYKKRETPIKEMSPEKFNKWKRYVNAQIDLEKFKGEFE